ncbi:MAG: large-conductance mechanosensitive channel protein MscL [Clostridiales Family XIII bacterium]|jgi:large conductance mechanosensitive channel|nr:large-conductance mechanosensitive channel protein MscL [Clostridiales Family XIII bacterium]
MSRTKAKNLIRKRKRVVDEFKQFALRGNVMDMAVGIVIGSAFGAIVNSFVNDLIMPIVGFLTAGKDFSQMKISFGEDSYIMYGNFIQTVVNFFVIALSIFVMVKVINRIRKPKIETPPPTETDVLMEIRDLLKETSSRDSKQGGH